MILGIYPNITPSTQSRNTQPNPNYMAKTTNYNAIPFGMRKVPINFNPREIPLAMNWLVKIKQETPLTEVLRDARWTWRGQDLYREIIGKMNKNIEAFLGEQSLRDTICSSFESYRFGQGINDILNEAGNKRLSGSEIEKMMSKVENEIKQGIIDSDDLPIDTLKLLNKDLEEINNKYPLNS